MDLSRNGVTAEDAARPGALREFALDIPLGRIRGLRGGRAGAPRVIALHGWLDNAASFVPLAAPLLAAHPLDLIALDLPGHGASPHLPPGADYSFAGALHTVLDVADALDWPRFALLGHSMGAGIASLIAAACPARITRLLAIEALGALPEAPERTAARLREAVAATRALPDKRLRVFSDLELAVRARMQANALSAPVARLLVERGVVAVDGGWTWSSDPRLTLPTMVRMTEAQVHDLIRGIACPTRVIYADPPQPYLPEPQRSENAARLPRGECVVVPGGHHLHMELPEVVAGAIGDFLARGDEGEERVERNE